MKVNFDPTVNLGHIGTALVFLAGLLGAYYDLKSDVRDHKTQADARWEIQKIVDTNQDQALAEVKGTIRTSTDELKTEIRTLRRN